MWNVLNSQRYVRRWSHRWCSKSKQLRYAAWPMRITKYAEHNEISSDILSREWWRGHVMMKPRWCSTAKTLSCRSEWRESAATMSRIRRGFQLCRPRCRWNVRLWRSDTEKPPPDLFKRRITVMHDLLLVQASKRRPVSIKAATCSWWMIEENAGTTERLPP